MKLEEFLAGKNVVAVVCNQWGDTGKGKIVDLIASEWADFIVRGTGGANAGHTINIGGEETIFHIIPSGILHDSEGKINVIGNGVAFDPREVVEEIEKLEKKGKTYNGLRIAYNGRLVLPQHIVADALGELVAGKSRIGTTMRGIGPVYSDHVARRGLFVNDMLNPDVLRSGLEKSLQMHVAVLKGMGISPTSQAFFEIMHDSRLENGAFYHQENFFDIDAIIEAYRKYGERLKDFIADTDEIVRKARTQEKRVLLEGAQGLLLSIDYGSYPYVTSSECSIPGLAKGVGLSEKDVDLVLGVVKAPYMTRVGGGPFPTEIGGKKSEEWCSSHTRQDEEKEFADASVNDADEFRRGVAVRRDGGEYGATTKRPRRTGWLDLPLLRYAIQVNGSDIVLTKLQVFDTADTIKICHGYIYQGDNYQLGRRTLKRGDLLEVAIPDAEVLRHCQPLYTKFRGWKTPTADIKDYDALPQKLRDVVEFIEKEAGVRARILSMGPDRNQTIIRS
ncbi:adenylosuccinate synthase [Candidatus Pacearchaeota archaeon]|nr:adenylosuccinate synthase [Candidatus Pacearchaeota archaeon]